MRVSQKLLVSLIIIGSGLISTNVAAQAMVETDLNVRIKGKVTHDIFWSIPFQYNDEMLPLDFVIDVTQQIDTISGPFALGGNVSFAYVDLTIAYELFDKTGMSLTAGEHTTLYPESNNCASQWMPVTYTENRPFPDGAEASADLLHYCVWTESADTGAKLTDLWLGNYSPWYYGPYSDEEAMLLQQGPAGSIYQLNSDGYPEPVLGETLQAIEFYTWVLPNELDNRDFEQQQEPSSEVTELDFGFQGYITSIERLVNDSDGDGIADEEDQCNASLLEETIVLNGIDSGVVNAIDTQGCSLMDRFAACNREAQSTSMFAYRGATYCETQITYQLYREGLIDYTDVRALRNALN